MSQDDTRIVLNGAISQLDRWREALGAGYAPVDGRSPAELLDFGVELASLVVFYNLNHQVDGDWVDFFVSDPTVLLASIAATDTFSCR